MTDQSAAPTDAPDEPGSEFVVINGQPVNIPKKVEDAGRQAMQQWANEQAAKALPKQPAPPAPVKAAATHETKAEG